MKRSGDAKWGADAVALPLADLPRWAKPAGQLRKAGIEYSMAGNASRLRTYTFGS